VSGTLTLRNRHRTRRVDLRLLRRIVKALLRETQINEGYDLGVYLVAAPEMTRLNETFLQHKGPTDVITFNYTEPPARILPASQDSQTGCSRRRQSAHSSRTENGADCRRRLQRDDVLRLGQPHLHGEIFICIDEAVSQARRFHNAWQSELVRYVVHGVLHLLGFDDRNSRARRLMKVAEDDLVRKLAQQFAFGALGSPPTGSRA
jgi:probable rRNA maturation factor